MARQRRRQIAEIVQAQGSARVSELADRFQTSEVTIRSDLATLEKDGQLIRDHGGAIHQGSPTPITTLLAVESRQALHREAKQRIAAAAAALVQPGDTILIDAGTTTVEMIPHLADIEGLTIVTNALNAVLTAASTTRAEILVLGGSFSRDASSTIGSMAETALDGLVIQKTFLATQAFDFENGLTDTTIEIAQVKRAMIRAARSSILLTDSSKWAHAGFVKVAPLTALSHIITDRDLPAAAAEAIRQAPIPLTLV